MGIPDLTPTMLRQSAEAIIQADEEMQKNSQPLNMHSNAVGRSIYHNVPTMRSQWVNKLDHLEASDKADEVQVDSDMEKEMNIWEEEDELARVEYAENFNLEDRFQRNINRRCSTRCRIPPNDRLFLQKIIYKKVFGSVYQFFPGNLLLDLIVDLKFLTIIFCRSYQMENHVVQIS